MGGRALREAAGFTLVELVAVIVLLGVVSVSIASLYTGATRGYVDTARRNNLAQVGRWAVERVSRELRAALPGSVRTRRVGGVECLEFMPVTGASRYLNLPLGSPSAQFDAVAFNTSDVAAGHYVAVYTLTENDVYASASNYLHPLASIGAPSAGQVVVSLSAPQVFAAASPAERFFVAADPVSFCVDGGDLTRYSGYGRNPVQPVPPASGSSALVAEHLRQDSASYDVFNFDPGTLWRGGIVHLDFRFAEAAQAEEVVYFSQEVALHVTP